MTHYLESILPKILSYSQKLDKLALLLNELWVVTGDDSKRMKLIFKADGEVVISENGDVQFGKWELLNRASSILIKYEKSAKLYNHAFFDEGILALKLDGSTDFFILANQNRIPDLNVAGYLNAKYESPAKAGLATNTNTIQKTRPYDCTTDKGQITIHICVPLWQGNFLNEGDPVTVDNQPAPDGKYKISTLDYIHVKNGYIQKRSMF